MLHFHKLMMCRNFILKNRVVRCYCQEVPRSVMVEWDRIRSKYSDKQLIHIINAINQSTDADMKKFGVSENYIRKKEYLRIDRTIFTSMEDFIAQDLMSVSELEAVCSIVFPKEGNSLKEQINKKPKKKANIISPPLKQSVLENLKTMVGLRIGINHISWSHLELNESNCNILNWDSIHIADLPLNASFSEIFNRGLTIANAIPKADVYVMERDASRSMSKLNSSMVKLLLRQQQYLSIIFTILSIRNSESCSDNFLPSLYTLRPTSSAQHFGLLLGHETISAGNLVQALFLQQDVGLKNIKSVIPNNDVLNHYYSLNEYCKEELNRTLLITLTFLDNALHEVQNE